MRTWGIVAAVAIAAVPAYAQTTWQRHSQPTGLTAELPGEPERFDEWTSIAKGRVIQLNSTIRNADFEMQAFFFLQAVIADKPYDVDAKLREFTTVGGDALSGAKLISQRPLRPEEMLLPGMRGVEVVRTYDTFGNNRIQVEYSRNMVVGNKWLSYSVRYFQGDKRWPQDRFFRSIGWKP